jgi:hypothetical protein
MVDSMEELYRVPNAGVWSYARRSERISDLLDVRRTIDGWMDLFVKMIALGYVPKNPANLLTADCLQPWNLVLDGGCVDCDSIIEAAAMDDAEIDDAVRRTVRSLILGVSYLMLGTVAMSIECRDRFPELTSIVLNEFSRRLAQEAENGGIPKACERLINSLGMYNDLDNVFRHATSSDHPG